MTPRDLALVLLVSSFGLFIIGRLRLWSASHLVERRNEKGDRLLFGGGQGDEKVACSLSVPLSPFSSQ